ncbi:MBOAT family O-acyltransferase [Pseudohalioglobus lutimaris]|uniref:MBOAT family O-acyltransferase n=1 Tax=Pseudohalioglobus lutimaris TaxID=1737061 RepID=UPI0010563BB7|nr:MBOAT family O-acyltransferase [Pseudohalioglobus lutimaris]
MATNKMLLLGIFFTLGVLAYFKYIPDFSSAFNDEPILQHIIIPLGISYYTFKLIHYGVEVQRGNFPEHSLGDFLSYIYLAPIFTAGPIERFEHFLAHREDTWKPEFFVEGTTRIIHGLIKKLVLGNIVVQNLMDALPGTEDILLDVSSIPAFELWAFCFLVFIYLYLDFSAYSDIAIGTSRLFGFRIMENFNWPIIALNISDFWKRWHMTLAGWCQYYVYLPMIGLTRNPHMAVYATFITIGLWHSGTAGWLLWGLYHATGVSAFGSWGRFRRKRRWKGLDRPGLRWVSTLVTLMFVSCGSVFTALDRVGSVSDMFQMFRQMLFFGLI